MAIALITFFCLSAMWIIFTHYIFQPIHKESEPYIISGKKNWINKEGLQEIYYPRKITFALYKGKVTHEIDTTTFRSYHFKKYVTCYDKEQAIKYLDKYFN